MPIRILKEGRAFMVLFHGHCSNCECVFEIPREEAAKRLDFRIVARAVGGTVVPRLPCPHCGEEALLMERREVVK